jgi:hypothetical protein
MAEPIGVLRSTGVSQCFRCGYGEECAAGAVVGKYGFLDEIKDYHRPILPKESYKNAEIIAQRLSEIIKIKRKK